MEDTEAKMQQVQKQVEQVKNVMALNIEEVLHRSDRLELLEEKSQDLLHSSEIFVRKSNKIKRRMWSQNCRVVVCVTALVTLFVLILAVILYSVFRK